MTIIRVISADGTCLMEKSGPGPVAALFPASYQEGDYIELRTDAHHARVKVDECMEAALVYLPSGEMQYRIPFGEERRAFPPLAFASNRHVIEVVPVVGEDVHGYRNLALNPADQRGDVTAYPHATANVETRNESVFAARNVIDGMRLSTGHGDWPYQSWGIGAREDACLMLDFGRPVRIDRMVLHLRADFPHDAYWTQATVVLSDGVELTFPLEPSEAGQAVALGEHTVSWLRLERLIKCDAPSAYPALKQLEVYGRDID